LEIKEFQNLNDINDQILVEKLYYEKEIGKISEENFNLKINEILNINNINNSIDDDNEDDDDYDDDEISYHNFVNNFEKNSKIPKLNLNITNVIDENISPIKNNDSSNKNSPLKTKRSNDEESSNDNYIQPQKTTRKLSKIIFDKLIPTKNLDDSKTVNININQTSEKKDIDNNKSDTNLKKRTSFFGKKKD
jgi:hypothetical protein